MLTALSTRLRQPFWPVTLVSGVSAFLTFAALLIIYLLTDQWQNLALSGLVAVIILAHGVAWRLASSRARFDHGIWLIAAAQIVSALLVPLFMVDFGIIGLFLMAVVPIEVGVADHLRRIPLFAVVSLVGAAGMVIIDLLDLPGRVTILADVPNATFLIVGFLTLHIAGLGFLLWHLRLRPGASHYTRLNLATQQTLVFTAIAAASIIAVTSVLVAQIRSSQNALVGQSFQSMAEIEAERVGNSLELQINALASLPRQEPILVESLRVANADYPASSEEVSRLLDQRARLWQVAPETDSLVQQIRNGAPALTLNRFRSANLLHDNVILTDQLGGLVAVQGERPERFYYGDQSWWLAVRDGGAGGYLGDLRIDPESRVASITIAVRVRDPQTEQILGVLASTFQLQSIQRDIGLARPHETGAVYLLDPAGIVIAGPDGQFVDQAAWSNLVASGGLPFGMSNSSPAGAGWLMGADESGADAVLAHSSLATTSRNNLDPLRALGWQVVVRDTQANALAGVIRSAKVASLVALLVMTLVVLTATATARVITRPIEALTTTASAISGGSLDHRAEPVGPVELVTLAEAFNTLTSRLRSLVDNLQEQVARRTSQLETRVNELATLNRVTQAVSSVRDLSTALEIVAREMVQLFNVRNCGIALLNEARTELTVVADFSREADRPTAVGVVIPVIGNPSSTQVIETGRSVVVSGAKMNPLTEPIHDLMESRGTEALLIVPLLARGEVIGTTGLATGEADREFTPAEVALAETIASQIAGAIDNARLLEETQQHVVELATISNISQALVSQLELNPLIELVGETIRRTFDAQIVYVALLDRQTDLVHFPYYFEVGHRDGGDPVELGQGLVSRVIETGQPLLLTHERQYEELDIARVGTPSKSYLGVPIAVGDGVIGAISVQSTQQGDQFDEADVRLLSTIAASVGVAIERARLYASAQQQKEYFESLVLNNPVAIITIDQTAKIISWNPAAEKLFGYSEAEAIDRNIDDLVARLESVRDQAVDYTQQTMRGGRVHAITQRTRKDGSLVDVEMLALPVTIPGRAIGYIVIYHDITELQRARQAAEAANQAKGNFLANVSHELRTPLTSVMGFAKIIKKRLDDVIFPNVQQQDDRRTQRAMKQVGDNINIILSEGQRLTTLINNVLDLAKIEAGKFEWRRQPVDVAEVVERAIAATSALFEHKDLELVRDIDPDLPSVIGDPDKLIQVVINLISNAVKFTDRGSVTCQVASKDGEVIVRVIDTGIGIALNDLPKVFDEFVQVGDTLTDKPQGTGLGLPICKQIVEHHGGHIWVESQPGVGSTFAFSLPFAAEAAGVRNGEGGKVKEVI